MQLTLAVLIHLLISSCFTHEVDVIHYLETYGYLDKIVDNSSQHTPIAIRNALALLQINFNITTIGDVTSIQSTEFVKVPRCGNGDNFIETISTAGKWSFNKLTWFSYSNEIPTSLIEKAFALWSKHADIEFIRSDHEPNIRIKMMKLDHTLIADENKKCVSPFHIHDSVLAHADFPNWRNITEIHINSDFEWETTMSLPAYNKNSLYQILVHEIGHTLGMRHDFGFESIMFPRALFPSKVKDLSEYDLSPADMGKLQSLYGLKPKPTKNIPTIVEKEVEEIRRNVDICTYRYRIDHVLLIDKVILMFHSDMVWAISLVQSRRQKYQMVMPYYLNNWLKFLPAKFSNMSAIYQNHNGEVVLFSDDTTYRFTYPQLKLIETKPFKDFIGLRGISRIVGAYTNRLGNTVLLTNENLIIQFDECRSEFLVQVSAMNYLNIDLRYISSIFSHTNGKLYLIHRSDNYLIEFDEYLQIPTGIVNSPLDLFNITCTEDGVINELYNLASKLVHLRS